MLNARIIGLYGCYGGGRLDMNKPLFQVLYTCVACMTRFQRLAGPKGTVSIPQFQSMVELGGNPFIRK